MTKNKKTLPPKRASFTPDGIKTLPDGRPAVYEITNKQGQTEYIGHAKRGRVQERLAEHLPGAQDAVRRGAQVVVRPKPNVDAARKSEAAAISRKQPLQNKRGK